MPQKGLLGTKDVGKINENPNTRKKISLEDYHFVYTPLYFGR